MFAEILCECRACGLKFLSAVVFDRHRVGDYDHAEPKYGRRCLTPAELQAAHMAPNAEGYWRTAVWFGQR
jgi:hypothetical protein